MREFSQLSAVLLLVVSVAVAALLPAVKAHAEGTQQMNDQQVLQDNTDVYVDLLNADEIINISLSANVDSVNVYDTQGTADLNDDTQVAGSQFPANLDPTQPLPSIITGSLRIQPGYAGTFRIGFENAVDDFYRYDFSVTNDIDDDPIPTATNGRIWSYLWRFAANSDIDYANEYPEETSTDADLYALVPAPNPNENFVWKLDLNNFAGGSYRLLANNTGLDAPYAGVSASMNRASVSTMYPLYLSYPEIAGNENSTTPDINSFTFKDDAGLDNVFSPTTTPGVEDGGTFTFTSNVSDATYAITIDTNKDGVYGTGDRLLLGSAAQGLNSVNWDGTYADGSPVPAGEYSSQLQLRIGEFHFVARDVEASGGTRDGQTWANGLTIYRALDQDTTTNTTVYWDDVTSLSPEIYNPDTDEYDPTGIPFAEASSNLPTGAISGSTADLNNDGKADGFHSWGNFEGNGIGDENFIDTFTYGATDSATTNLRIAAADTVVDTGSNGGVISNPIGTVGQPAAALNAPNTGAYTAQSTSISTLIVLLAGTALVMVTTIATGAVISKRK